MKKSIFIFLLIVLPTLAGAVTSIGSGIVANINPENPGPNEPVTVKLESYSVDLDRSLITWYINKQKISAGIGQKTLSNKVGQLGIISNWSVVVETPSGQELTGNINFNPAIVNLLWQAETYVPTWYLGKALPSPSSQVKILALVEIKKVTGQSYKNSELVYNWYREGKFLSVSSGVGKDNINITTNNDFTPTKIELKVSSLDQTTNTNGSLELKNTNPKLLIFPQASSTVFYPFGNSITLDNSITTLIVEPFYFSNQDFIDNNLLFNWKLNNKTVTPDPTQPNSLTPNLSSFSGPVNLNLEVKNKKSFFQSASYQGIIKLAPKSSLFNL
ncbi:MAG: hypothetical protein Q7T49_01310 [bacterium]|nr:hypothetical protein [bacterium]